MTKENLQNEIDEIKRRYKKHQRTGIKLFEKKKYKECIEENRIVEELLKRESQKIEEIQKIIEKKISTQRKKIVF